MPIATATHAAVQDDVGLRMESTTLFARATISSLEAFSSRAGLSGSRLPRRRFAAQHEEACWVLIGAGSISLRPNLSELGTL
jgi:hypothetical protein